MVSRALLLTAVAIVTLTVAVDRAAAQQVAIENRFNGISDSFFERIGIGFGFDINGGRNVVGLNPLGNPTRNGAIQFRQGSVGATAPAFGGFNPNTAGTIGFGIKGSGFNAGLTGIFGQGSSRSISSIAPKVVIPNGGTGTVSETTQQPFVTGFIPVVGANGGMVYNVPRPYWPTGGPTVTYPLHDTIQRYYANREQLQREGEAEHARDLARRRAAAKETGGASTDVSSATRGDLSVAEIRRRKAALDAAKAEEKEREVAILIERARGAEDAGKTGVAKVYLKQAAAKASGELRQKLIEKIRSLNPE